MRHARTKSARSSFARSALALVLTAGLAAAPAVAEELATPAFKLSNGKPAKAQGKDSKATAKPGGARRPGELEGWDRDAKVASPSGKSKLPPGAIGERAVPDGGLPLPERRSNEPGAPPIGFDQNGNMGGAFRF